MLGIGVEDLKRGADGGDGWSFLIGEVPAD
jgi:hypothetical protein